MNSRVEVRGASLDTVKLAVAAFLLLIGILAFYYFSSVSAWIRVIALLAVGAGAIFVALQTERGRQVWQFVSDSRVEVRKVVWPSRQETIQTTLIVVLMVFVVGLVLWLFDMLLMGVLRFLTGQGG